MIVSHLTDTNMSIYKISLSLSSSSHLPLPHPTLRHRNLCAGFFGEEEEGGGGRRRSCAALREAKHALAGIFGQPPRLQMISSGLMPVSTQKRRGGETEPDAQQRVRRRDFLRGCLSRRAAQKENQCRIRQQGRIVDNNTTFSLLFVFFFFFFFQFVHLNSITSLQLTRSCRTGPGAGSVCGCSCSLDTEPASSVMWLLALKSLFLLLHIQTCDVFTANVCWLIPEM